VIHSRRALGTRTIPKTAVVPRPRMHNCRSRSFPGSETHPIGACLRAQPPPQRVRQSLRWLPAQGWRSPLFRGLLPTERGRTVLRASFPSEARPPHSSCWRACNELVGHRSSKYSGVRLGNWLTSERTGPTAAEARSPGHALGDTRPCDAADVDWFEGCR